jgi:alpha-L-rhamnosidase
VTPDWDEDTSRLQLSPLLRREFVVRPGLRRARLYVTALGAYEAQLNGVTVGDHVMAPGWTSYNYRLRYQTFDVTGLLAEGRNALVAILGDGWYRGRLGYHGGRRNIYGDRLAPLAQLEIEYADGTVERVVTDESKVFLICIPFSSSFILVRFHEIGNYLYCQILDRAW